MSRRLWDFHGGVHPAQNKKQSSETSIRAAGLPDYLVVPVQQHIGTPAHPIVGVGDRVLKGQVLAQASGFVSVPCHASTSGTVTAIEPRPIQHPSQMDALCVVIEPDGAEQWVEREGLGDYTRLDKPTVLQCIRDAGIAGMGGAGFPSVVKLGVKPDQKIKTLVLNAVECEPYITADDRLMRERAADIVTGLQIVAWLVEPEEILIGIEDNKPLAIEAMRQATADTAMEVVVVPTKYPSGGEKQLIQMLTGKEVRSGGIPADVGVICHNTGTAYAIKRAVLDGEPLISRITTITGDCVPEKGNYEVALGTPVGWLLQQAGVKPTDLHRLIVGGPMMGFAVHNMAVPVVKTTNCLLVPTAREFPDPAPEQPCIRCGSCAQVCPAQLLPQQLYWFAKAREFDKAMHYNLADCIECGACSYVCPSNIPLVQYYRFAKGEIRNQQQEQQKADHARQRFEARQARLAKEEEEKERKRQERAKAAAAKQAKKAPAASAAPAAGEAGNPSDSATELNKLQTAAAATMKRYKDAQKALAQAEKSGSGNLEALQQKVAQLQAKADAAKTAFQAARAEGAAPEAQPPSAPAEDPLAALKAASAEDFAAYKAAEKAYEAARDQGADDAETLRLRMEELKQRSEASKTAMKEARAKQREAIQRQNAAADPLKAAQIEVAKHQVLLKKASKALQAAKDSDAGAIDHLQAKVEEAEHQLQAAENTLKQLQQEHA